MDLAAKTANKDKHVEGITFKVEALDDQGQPSVGQQNASQFVANDKVLGVVGPLNSSVGESMQQVFESGNMALVSPGQHRPLADPGPGLAHREEAPVQDLLPHRDHRRHPGSVRRAVRLQRLQEDEGLRHRRQEDLRRGPRRHLHRRVQEARRQGRRYRAHQPGHEDFSAVATKVKNSGADVVYYGGEYPQAGPLSKQIKSTGAKIPLVGGDGIYSADFIKLAGASGTGDLATSVGAPVEELPSAKEFVANYKAAGYKEPFEAYGGYSYDSAWAIIEAVKTVVEKNDGKLPRRRPGPGRRGHAERLLRRSDRQGLLRRVR